jgi:NTP pyrophosphatase (non-canonical NTP hydrolase)
MTFDQYEAGVAKTWNSTVSASDQMMNALLGIVGEAGELAEAEKKRLFHGIPHNTDTEAKELGDLLYYITARARLIGYTLAQIAVENNQKLKARYPEGFRIGGGNR